MKKHDKEAPEYRGDFVSVKLRLMRHLPVQDLLLIVLKGHLLIEELLYVIVKKAVKHPEFVQRANLRFIQVAYLARAIHYEDRLRPVWDAILSINTLRNTFAHDVEAKKLEGNLRALARAVAGENPEAERNLLANPEKQLRDSIEVICGVLSAIAYENQKRKKGKTI